MKQNVHDIWLWFKVKRKATPEWTEWEKSDCNNQVQLFVMVNGMQQRGVDGPRIVYMLQSELTLTSGWMEWRSLIMQWINLFLHWRSLFLQHQRANALIIAGLFSHVAHESSANIPLEKKSLLPYKHSRSMYDTLCMLLVVRGLVSIYLRM